MKMTIAYNASGICYDNVDGETKAKGSKQQKQQQLTYNVAEINTE